LKALRKEADERLLIEAVQKDPVRFAKLYEDNFVVRLSRAAKFDPPPSLQ
jgi:hypothetical protein